MRKGVGAREHLDSYGRICVGALVGAAVTALLYGGLALGDEPPVDLARHPEVEPVQPGGGPAPGAVAGADGREENASGRMAAPIAPRAFRTGAAFEAWLLSHRRRLATATEAVLHEAALSRLAHGDLAAAREHAGRATTLSPLDGNHQALPIRQLDHGFLQPAAPFVLQYLIVGTRTA